MESIGWGSRGLAPPLAVATAVASLVHPSPAGRGVEGERIFPPGRAIADSRTHILFIFPPIRRWNK